MSAAVRPGHHETTLAEARAAAAVDAEGHVHARDAEQTYIGQYPGASEDETLRYFSRKFDELANRALLLRARVRAGSDSAEALGRSRDALESELEAQAWVGDVASVRTVLAEIGAAVAELGGEERRASEEAMNAHLARREEIVAEAEAIAAQDPAKTHWKESQSRMDGLFQRWKAEQKRPPRLTKAQEDPYWKRFRAARTTFDKGRRAFFSRRDEEQAEVRRTKEHLIAEAEGMRTSTDFGPTTKAYHRLMEDWKAAGRGSRRTDDAQWARFRAAQDEFFAAREAANAETDRQYARNLEVKQGLLAEFEALMPFTDPDAVRERYHDLLDRWDAAGRVPRSEMRRTEDAVARIQDAFREAEQRRWHRGDPETQARQDSVLAQIDASVAALEEKVRRAAEAGDEATRRKAQEDLDARLTWRDIVARGS
ncbi:MAG: DUF349 domain-containing protein [Nesterenkonia sp.]|nr:DUF349 domain-containing protein [Nesterenkonia sp.]